MPVHSIDPSGDASPTATDGARDRRRFAWLAGIAAVYTYALIVFGGIVRITGSGMGCGDDWPRCNGQWIPAFDAATLIEYGHRMLAAGMIVPVAAVIIAALRLRTRPGFRGAGGAVRPVIAMAGLFIVQVLLGAITVKLELPAGTTVLHFVTASLILAALVLAVVRALAVDWSVEPAPRARGAARAATAAAALGLVVVAFGALTANTGAAALCQGFPLCNGRWIPEGSPYVHIHWTHRLLAFGLLAHVVAATVAVWRRGAPLPVRRAAAASLGMIVLQVAVAAALVLLDLPPSLQAAHLAVGVGVWASLVVWASLATRAARARSPANATPERSGA